ncbi:SDR family oxidoreductase [uncultured Salegentibacter sp.]|uniref:SDR family NAD(P)-dependent oxidoreductase n=1 Tax=uncultured Salegentibacter sp. TaxID=259320 RepID=UPI0030DADF27
MFRLDKKVALVTGGGSGIGKAITETLSKSGAIVYVLDIQEEQGDIIAKQLCEEGFQAYFLKCDVSDQDRVNEIFAQIFQKEKRLDILINNAGVSHIGIAHNTSEEDFDRIFRINVKGVYNCLHQALPLMKEGGGGAIVNLTSVAAQVGLPDRFAYSMSKGAVSSMTLSVARDYLSDNIRCNGIAPGRVHTPFVDGFLSKNYPGKEQEMFEKLAKTQPLGRMGKPEEIAKLVLYLSSDDAAFITGSIYPIDGGFVSLNT